MATDAVGFGRGASWCIVIAVAISAGAALAQTRTWVGGIQPVTPAAKVADRAPTVVVKLQPHKPKPQSQVKRQPKAKVIVKPKPQPKAKSARKPPVKRKVVRPKLRLVDDPQPLATDKSEAPAMEDRWQAIQTALRPASLIVLCEQFARAFPASQFTPQVAVVEARARQALEIQRSAGLSGDFFEDVAGDSSFREYLRQAVRGDKDAAYSIALAYKSGAASVDASPRRMVQWLLFSAELGSGVASWELAQIYNRDGLIADAARFEKKALDLGFRPPPRLPTRGY